MLKISIILILTLFSYSAISFGQEETDAKLNEIILTDEENIILFLTAIIIVIIIIIFINRNIIFGKKTAYDKGSFSSQKDRDYEKYHSEWSDDFEESKIKSSEDDEIFRKAVNESSLPNYYEILGLRKTATQVEIKNKFRKLAKESHPDKTTDVDAENKMAEFNKAYEILSDPVRRERYDKYLKVS